MTKLILESGVELNGKVIFVYNMGGEISGGELNEDAILEIHDKYIVLKLNDNFKIIPWQYVNEINYISKDSINVTNTAEADSVK